MQNYQQIHRGSPKKMISSACFQPVLIQRPWMAVVNKAFQKIMAFIILTMVAVYFNFANAQSADFKFTVKTPLATAMFFPASKFDQHLNSWNIDAATDGDFTAPISNGVPHMFSGSETPVLLTNTPASLWPANVSIPNNAMFTNATTFVPAPGGVTAGLKLWLKADAGTSSTSNMTPCGNWTDQFAHAVLTPTGSPTYIANSINYRPAVYYTSADYHSINSPAIAIPNSTVFVAGIPVETSGGPDGWYAPWASDDETDYPLILFDQKVGHYGNGDADYDYAHTWAWGQPGFAREHIYNNADVAISTEGAAAVILSNRSVGAGNYFDFGGNDYGEGFGNMAESIIYNTASLSAQDINKIETYLALKYSLPKDMNDGNYTLSDGSTAWTADAAYQKQLIGIARDDASALLQKQSHTTDDSLRLFINSLAADNTSNSGSIGNDLSSVIIGNNGGLLQRNLTAAKPPGITNIFDRSWKITNTNFADSYAVEIKWDSMGTFNINDVRLLVSATPNFSSATIIASGSMGITISQGSIIVSGINPAVVPVNSTRFFTIGSASVLTTLPVELTAFTASAADNNKVAINWQTASEVNSDYFIVERSANNNSWKTAAQVKAAGNSSAAKDYSTVDKNPYSGVSYYRLKQTNADGNYKYSDVRTIKIDKARNSAVVVYPNPVAKQLTIKGDATELKTIKLFNAAGQDVTGAVKTIQQNSDGIVLDLSTLPGGTYSVKTINTLTKVIKL